MTPTYEELLQGATKWNHSHHGVQIILSHHGFSSGGEYEGARPRPGTWCYYLMIPEQMYPHRWDDFKCIMGKHGYESPGPAFTHDMFDSEITYSRSHPYFDRHEKRTWDLSKIGCDYAHLWNEERGYPDTYESVKRDAELTVEKFLTANPDRCLKCEYSHKWGTPDDFYTAKNGRRVHNSYKGTFEGGWIQWEPDSEGETA